MKVKDLQDREDIQFLSDSQDVEDLRKEYPNYMTFFVVVGDGEYTQIYGMNHVIPFLEHDITKLL